MAVCRCLFVNRAAKVKLFNDCGGTEIETCKQHLFKLFYRGEQEKVAEGHGIGMALSQKIIRLHRGDIAVHSEKEKGTTFIVELPHI